MGAVSTWWKRWELPTWLVAAAVYAGFFVVASQGGVWGLPILAVLVAWHGSLQHETIHGHPTRVGWINAAIGSVPLGLILPYGIYRESHIAHHTTPSLTAPGLDPESFYVCPKAWDTMCQAKRLLRKANATLVGRLVLGPWFAWSALVRDELRKLARGDGSSLKHWALHLALVVPLVLWIHEYSSIALWQYLVFAVYPASSITLLRSFAEHHPGREGERTAVVLAHPFFSLLFLHNNLHVLHHKKPGLAWFEYPERYREDIAPRGGYRCYSGYAEVWRRFAFRSLAGAVAPRIESTSAELLAGRGARP